MTQKDVFIPAPRSDQWQWDPEQIDRYLVESSVSSNNDLMILTTVYLYSVFSFEEIDLMIFRS